MACTIDHLVSDHRVTVLQDFTDARGVVAHAGETAIVRRMDLDFSTLEIWIDWERDGKPQRLHFPLKATSGPGNGRMRQYFEVGECVTLPPRPATPAPTPEPVAPTAGQPQRPEESLAPFEGRQAPADTNLSELTVACDCDPRFHRPIGTRSLGVAVHACLHCGSVTASRMVGDDGRFHGDAWHANLTVRLPDDVHAWLARWPRVRVTRKSVDRWPMADELTPRDHLYIPASTRCSDVSDLEALETRLEKEQRPLNDGQRLRSVRPSSQPPPPGLPPMLADFNDLWGALQLTPQSDPALLISKAQLRSAASGVAVDLLCQRPDRDLLLAKALKSKDPACQSAGHALALALGAPSPALISLLIGILQELRLEPNPDVPTRIRECLRLESLLVLILELKIGAPEMITALNALRRAIARKDSYSAEAIGITLRELASSQPDPRA